MWKELIKKISNDCEFNPPATHAQILMAQEKLNITFPDDLKNCLMESNGVTGEYGLGLIWPTARIVTENLEFRNNKGFRDLYMPFNSLLFFADAGNGDQFAYPIQAGTINRNDIFVWNHEDDSRIWLASNLRSYLEGWLTGKIKI